MTLLFQIRLRDCSLQAITLASQRLHERWQVHLLRNLTLTTLVQLPVVYTLLEKDDSLSKHIRHLSLARNPRGPVKAEDLEEGNASEALLKVSRQISISNPKCIEAADIEMSMVEFVLARAVNLETLVLSSEYFSSFPLVRRANLVPFEFLTRSLKSLYSRPGAVKSLFSLQNVAWLLLFCPNLSRVALSFSVALASFNYSVEYLEIFKGRSRVQHLALEPMFVWDTIASSEGSGRWLGYHRKEKSACL